MLYLIFPDRFHFVRRFFRRFMKPMSVEEAEAKKAMLAKAYFFISLVTFGSVLYQVKQGRLDWIASEGLAPNDEAKLSPAFQYARMLGVDKATVIRIKGASVMGTKDYDKESFDPAQHVLEEENSSKDPERKFLQL
ncbi:uncharacterized protein LOC132921294 isoform X1 [Rhopalosiphum padi]|uniref:uncharacterized protein LOC132921294 isoform X1 n=1 Tax=Rhopalosiphum padi TaxID=40932 RepID=UPI00298DE988|nr:uncharacterized protein LOC132921294 isoform X1 [Rhopalosiphum padi]